MRAIAPRTGAPEVQLATDQEEYREITAAVYSDPTANSPVFATRWTLTDAERLAVAEGADIFVTFMTFGKGFPPMNVLVGPQYLQVEPK